MKASDFLARIFARKKQSVWIAVLGKKQSGKTDLCLLIMEILYKQGLIDAFGSNVPLDAPFPVDFIEDFKTLEQRCRMLNPAPKKHGLKRYLFFASEMGKWLPKDQAWRNVKFIEKLQTVRKYGLNWIGDAIDSVDRRVLNDIHFEGCFTKLSATNPTVARYENWITHEVTTLKNIPKTSIDFDTWYSASFYMEPQVKNGTTLPLNYEHEIAFKYLELGSWKKVGVSTQEGKRCLHKVIRFHKDHCLQTIVEDLVESAPIGAEIPKGSVEVTE